ncbi:MAG: hypothetical protein MSC31_11775 [Solirubrobacteraceae bacterium MAG38_C4-C5]|nr:hypothetical protein [Candidatus Siliceabacter maunaloa]
MPAEARVGVGPATRRRWIAAGVAVVILVGGAAMLIGRELITPDLPDPPARAADGLVAFADPQAGISISHPPGWRRIASADPAVALLAEGDGASMLVRTADLGVEVGNLDTAKEVSDDLVRAGQPTLLRPPKQVTLGGLPGYLYLYTFPDAATGQRGAHAHYFLFRDQTLITVVFQTVPAEGFATLAPLFDRIAETLRASPG